MIESRGMEKEKGERRRGKKKNKGINDEKKVNEQVSKEGLGEGLKRRRKRGREGENTQVSTWGL